MGSEFERLAAEKYVMVTTFRKTGAGVPTPVWTTPLDGELTFVSEAAAGKVKRIRNSGRVEVQACDVRGKETHGAVATGEARLLDHEGTENVRKALSKKYLIARVTNFFGRLRGKDKSVGIAIKLSES
jgi:PPOX class probable F420-dependent enzyme